MPIIDEKNLMHEEEERKIIELAEMGRDKRARAISERVAEENGKVTDLARKMADFVLGSAQLDAGVDSLSLIYGKKVAEKLVAAKPGFDRLSILSESVRIYDSKEIDVLSSDLREITLRVDGRNRQDAITQGAWVGERMSYKIAAKATLLECGLKLLESDDSNVEQLKVGRQAIVASAVLSDFSREIGMRADEKTVVEPMWATARLASALEKLSRVHENDDVENFLAKFELPGVITGMNTAYIVRGMSERSQNLGEICKTIEDAQSRILKRSTEIEETGVLEGWEKAVNDKREELVSEAFEVTKKRTRDLLRSNQYFNLNNSGRGEFFVASIYKGPSFGPDMNKFVELCTDMATGGDLTNKFVDENQFLVDVAGHDRSIFEKKCKREGVVFSEQKWKEYIAQQIRSEAEGHLFGVLAVAIELNDKNLAVKVMGVLGQGDMLGRLKSGDGEVDKVLEMKMRNSISDKTGEILVWAEEADKQFTTINMTVQFDVKENLVSETGIEAGERARIEEIATRFINESGKVLLDRLKRADISLWPSQIDLLNTSIKAEDKEFADALFTELKQIVNSGGDGVLFTRKDDIKTYRTGWLSLFGVGTLMESHAGNTVLNIENITKEAVELDESMKAETSLQKRAKREALKVLSAIEGGALKWNRSFPVKSRS